MKCEVCGANTDSDAGNVSSIGNLALEPHALTIWVNGDGTNPVKATDFLAVFGFWDQRQTRNFCICGACLAERLRGGDNRREFL